MFEMGESEKNEEDLVDEYTCENCKSHEVVFVENEYIMGRELKKYLCETCGTKFFITRD